MVTTQEEAITALSPMVTPFKIIAPAPIHALLPIETEDVTYPPHDIVVVVIDTNIRANSNI